ncbi:retrotransposon protein, putative, ty1-copia subclass [Tanacetum coccineum]
MLSRLPQAFSIWFRRKRLKRHYMIYGIGRILNYLTLECGGDVLVKRSTPNKLETNAIKCKFIGYPKKTADITSSIQRRTKYLRTIIEKPSTSSIILRDYELVVEEANPTNFFEEAPPNNQENNIAHDALVLRRSEMQSMKDNEVWDLVDLTHESKTVSCNWVFMKKTDMDGNVNTFKAILAAKGYTHIQGVDHSETYSPEVSTPAIGCYLQMDVKTAFLNGRLYEDAYMEQPDGF